MKYTIETLKKSLDKGEQLDFLFFWKLENKGGSPGRDCLSQWYPCKFTVDEVTYNCAEQYMMAQKAYIFGDEEIYKLIMKASDPQIIKDLGKLVHGFDEEEWEMVASNVVLKGNIFKFVQNPELRKFLQGSGKSVLAEASPYDHNWGIGLKETDYRAQNPLLWKGKNKLGFILMEVREILATV